MKKQIKNLIIQLAKQLANRKWKLVTAESCTGGGLAYHLCLLPSASSCLEQALVTYSDLSKTKILKIATKDIQKYGPVSEEIAIQMADHALKVSKAHISIAITGLAGPEHDGISKFPLGTVFIACASKNNIKCGMKKISGNRELFCEKTIQYALELTLELVKDE